MDYSVPGKTSLETMKWRQAVLTDFQPSLIESLLFCFTYGEDAWELGEGKIGP